MQQFRLAVAVRSFREPIRTALQSAVDAGVKGVQLEFGQDLPLEGLSESARRDFLHLLRELGLSLASTTITLRQPLTEPRELDRRLAAIRTAMTSSFPLGSRVLTLRIGRIPADASSREYALLREVMNDLGTHANHVGVSLAITPTQDTAAALAGLLGEIGTGPVGIDFDPAHFVMSGQNSAEALRDLHSWVWHVQLRDGLRDFAGGAEETVVGGGAVDWPEVLALLAEMDYQGWMTAMRTQGPDLSGDVVRGLRYIRRLLPG